MLQNHQNFLHGLFDSNYDSTSNGFDGHEHIKKHILEKGDVDVFIHSWEVDKKDLIELIEIYQDLV